MRLATQAVICQSGQPQPFIDDMTIEDELPFD
jgi:hypothetical protein